MLFTLSFRIDSRHTDLARKLAADYVTQEPLSRFALCFMLLDLVRTHGMRCASVVASMAPGQSPESTGKGKEAA